MKKIKKKFLIYVNFMLVYVKIIKKKFFFRQTDRQTHVQLKTIVRNLTKFRIKKIEKNFI